MSEYADSVNVPAETDGAPQTPDMIVADKFDDLLGTRPNPQTEETDEPTDEYEDDVQEDKKKPKKK